MKYTREERIEIGRDIYTSGMSCANAMAKYNLSHGSVERYVSMYKEAKRRRSKLRKRKE